MIWKFCVRYINILSSVALVSISLTHIDLYEKLFFTSFIIRIFVFVFEFSVLKKNEPIMRFLMMTHIDESKVGMDQRVS